MPFAPARLSACRVVWERDRAYEVSHTWRHFDSIYFNTFVDPFMKGLHGAPLAPLVQTTGLLERQRQAHLVLLLVTMCNALEETGTSREAAGER